MRHQTSIKLCSALFGLALAGAACSSTQKTPLTPTSQVPAAEGKVETKRTDNRNTEVKLEVEHMAPPNMVAGDATVYVVWAQPLDPGAQPQNMGSFVIDEDRKGELRTITPQEKFELLVTPERTGAVERPTNEPVLKAKIAPKE